MTTHSTPAPVQLTHESGLTVLHHRRAGSPVVALQAWVRAGSADELQGQFGLAHVHEHMLFKGTARRGVGEVAREIESIGGSVNAWTSFDETVYHLVVPSRFAGVGVDVLVDALRNSAFEATELESELQVIQEEILRGEDMPSRVLGQNMFAAVFREHPYGRPIIGTNESVAAFTRENVLDYFAQWYRPQNITLVVVGDIEERALMQLLDEAASGWTGSRTQPPRRSPEPPQRELRSTVDFRDVRTSHLNLAFRGPALADDDVAPLEVLATLLGGGESALLFERLQRGAGLVNGAYAYLYAPRDPGMLLIGASFRGSVGEDGSRPPEPLEVLAATSRELARAQHVPFSSREIRRAVRMIESDAIYETETVQGVAQRIGYFHTVAGDVEFERRFREQLASVGPDDILRVAREYLVPSRMTVGMMLPDTVSSHGVTHERIAEAVTDAWEGVEADLSPVHSDSDDVVVHHVEGGPTIIAVRDDTSPTFAIRAAVLAGLYAESDANNGINALTAHLLTSGTTTNGTSELARRIDELAASVSGVGGRNSIGLAMSGLSVDFDEALDIFAECLFESSFPADEVARLRRESLDAIDAREDNLAGSAMRQFNRYLYAAHPYAMTTLGERASMTRITRQDLIDYHRATLRPERMVVSVVGDIDPEHMVRSIAARFTRDVEGPGWEFNTPAAPPAADAQWLQSERDRQQAHIVVGFPAASMLDDDAVHFELLAAVLGGQGGRLFVELRDRQSLAYSVSAFATQGYDVGSFAVYIATGAANVDLAVEEIRRLLRDVAAGGITNEELERAQRYLIGRRDVSMQSRGNRATSMTFNELYGRGYRWGFPDAYAERVNAVTAEDIRDAASRLSAEREVVSVVRPSPPPGAE